MRNLLLRLGWLLFIPLSASAVTYLWFALALGGRWSGWVEITTLLTAPMFVAFALTRLFMPTRLRPALWLGGLAGLLLLPALLILFVLEPYQRQQARIVNLMAERDTLLRESVAQRQCADGAQLLVHPWVLLTQNEVITPLHRLVYLPPDPLQRPLTLVRDTVQGPLTLPELQDVLPQVEACLAPPSTSFHELACPLLSTTALSAHCAAWAHP